MMRVGILHQYSLFGSGSGVYARNLAHRLARRGHRVCLISRDFHPDRYDFIEEAFFHRRDGVRFLFRRSPSPRCVSHTLLGDVVPLAYPRPERPNGKLFTELSDGEIRRYVDYQARKVQEIALRHRLEVLHANHALLMPYVARLVKAQLDLPYVVTVHGSTIEYVLKKDERYRPYAVRGLGEAERIIVLNRDVRERVLAFCPDAEARLVELPVGVDVGLFRPVAPSVRRACVAALLREAHRVERSGKTAELQELTYSLPDLGLTEGELLAKLSEIRASYTSNYPDKNLRGKLRSINWAEERVIIYFGQLSLEKGVHCLIAAMPEILARHPEVRLLVVGDGVSRELLEFLVAALDRGDVELARRVFAAADGEFTKPLLGFLDALDLEDYRRKARDANLHRAVILTGYLTQRELARLLPCAELSVIPSLVREAFPLVFVESLACGVLPVAPRFGGLAPAVDELTAKLGPIGEMAGVGHGQAMIHDLAERIPVLLSRLEEEGVRERVTRLCRGLAVRRYDWEKVVSRLEGIYSESGN
ncbi:MAG TPA: glycosyltransferase [Anaerolineae bacterium]|nr:glycosyltransferase [Anaerolineae bacterium]